MFSLSQLVSILTAAQLFIKDKILQPVVDPFRKINDFFESQLTIAKNQGIEDGKSNSPSLNDTSSYEQKLKSLMRSAFTQISTQAKGHTLALNSALDAMLQEVMQTNFFQSCKLIEDAFENKVQIFKSKIKQIDDQIRTINHSFVIAKSEASRLSGQTDGVGFFIKYPLMIYLMLSIIGFLDLPFSVAALEQMNFDNMETQIVALAIVVAVAILSHFAGLYLKRYKTHPMFFWLTFIPVILFIIFASIVRYTTSTLSGVLSESESYDFNSTNSSLDLVDKISSFSLGAAVSDPNFWFFILMNFVILLVGILFSYYVHDSNSNFEKSWRSTYVKVPRLQSSISKIELKIADEEALAKITLSQKSHLIDDNLRNLVQKYEEALDAYNQIATLINAKQMDIEDKYNVLINEYREQNLKNRTDQAFDIWNKPVTFSFDRTPLRENNILRFFK